jgi:hypothetical protein
MTLDLLLSLDLEFHAKWSITHWNGLEMEEIAFGNDCDSLVGVFFCSFWHSTDSLWPLSYSWLE